MSSTFVKTVLWYKRAVEEVVVLDMWSLAAVNTWHLTQPSSFDLCLDNAREELRCSDTSETCSFNGKRYVERVDVDMFCEQCARICGMPAVTTKCKSMSY